mmetsp:Transcript_50702/g.127200  ORF Transcript_50702/g.127200 Transcript_50702/m.127200 type:complete len:215 (-) Transcript_50702:361-1005(-)
MGGHSGGRQPPSSPHPGPLLATQHLRGLQAAPIPGDTPSHHQGRRHAASSESPAAVRRRCGLHRRAQQPQDQGRPQGALRAPPAAGRGLHPQPQGGQVAALPVLRHGLDAPWGDGRGEPGGQDRQALRGGAQAGLRQEHVCRDGHPRAGIHTLSITARRFAVPGCGEGGAGERADGDAGGGPCFGALHDGQDDGHDGLGQRPPQPHPHVHTVPR